MKDKLLKIINTYGVLPQLKYFQSEVFEFNQAVIDYQGSGWDFNDESCKDIEREYRLHIAEELADIMVMLEQFKAYYELDNQEIMDIMEYKINRQIDRINKGE